MTRRDNSAGDINHGHQADNNSDLSEKISKFTRSLIYGGSDSHWISSDDHKKLQEQIDTAKDLLDVARNMRRLNAAMLNSAVHSDEYEKLYQEADRAYREAVRHNRKKITSQHTNENLSDWKKASDKLSELTRQIQKEPRAGPRRGDKETARITRKGWRNS